MISASLNIQNDDYGFLIEVVEDTPESRMDDQPGTHVNNPAWTFSRLNASA